jgi:hypothetical protein
MESEKGKTENLVGVIGDVVGRTPLVLNARFRYLP